MARDAQLSGDRVQMEYYLQYAEHYFRVLNESRARFEEQRRQRGDDSDDSDDYEDDGAEASNDRDEEREQDNRPQRKERSRRAPRADRKEANGSEPANVNGERIALEALPPAIGRDGDEQSDTSEEQAERPRRRTRRPRAQDGEGEIAPAA